MPVTPDAYTHGLSRTNVNDTVESLFARDTSRSTAIYLTTIALVIAGAIAIATISVDVTIRAPMAIAPRTERQTLRLATDGRVERMLITNGARVSKGDTLLTLAENAADRQRAAASIQLATRQTRIHDLRALIDMRPSENPAEQQAPPLKTTTGRANWRETLAEWRQETAAVSESQRIRDRTARLAARGFAMPTELETADANLTRLRDTRALALERRRAEWSSELATAEQEVVTLSRDTAQLVADRSARFIVAPVGGTVQDIAALSAGSLVRAGDAVATISPDDALVAESLVSPRDVVFLRVGMPARLIIEGFDMQAWGAANGVVSSVASDVTVVGARPVFRVRITPAVTDLHRPDGRHARLLKGLRGEARFIVTRKRVVQLLRHRMGDWLDPAHPAAGDAR